MLGVGRAWRAQILDIRSSVNEGCVAGLALRGVPVRGHTSSDLIPRGGLSVAETEGSGGYTFRGDYERAHPHALLDTPTHGPYTRGSINQCNNTYQRTINTRSTCEGVYDNSRARRQILRELPSWINAGERHASYKIGRAHV